jgi:hypothetical protein
MLNPEKILSAINIMNDELRKHLDIRDPQAANIALVYDTVYGDIIQHLSHPEPVVVFDSLPPLGMCRGCQRN